MERPASIASEKEGRSPADEPALGYTDERVVPRWKRVIGGVGSPNGGTQRGMHSRHLIMIGAPAYLCFRHSRVYTDTSPVKSTRRNYWHRYILECRSGQFHALYMRLHHAHIHSQSIALAGPGATLLSYALVGVFVYAVVIPLFVHSPADKKPCMTSLQGARCQRCILFRERSQTMRHGSSPRPSDLR
jgi:hypothetical protein